MKKSNDRHLSIKITDDTYKRLIEITARKSIAFGRVHHLGDEAGRLLAKALDNQAPQPLVDDVVSPVEESCVQ